MPIHSLDDAKDLAGVCRLLQTPGEVKLENGWFGRTIVIGDIKFSESNLFEKLTPLVKHVTFKETYDDMANTALCVRRIIEIWENEQKCSVIKRLFQKIFFPIAQLFGYKKAFTKRDLRDLENVFLRITAGTEGRFLFFMEAFGNQFPKLRHVYACPTTGLYTTGEYKKKIFEAFVEEVPFNQMQNVFNEMIKKEVYLESVSHSPHTITDQEMKQFLQALDKPFLAKKMAKDCGNEKLDSIFEKLLQGGELSAEDREKLQNFLKSEDLRMKVFSVIKSVDTLFNTHITQDFQKAHLISSSMDVD